MFQRLATLASTVIAGAEVGGLVLRYYEADGDARRTLVTCVLGFVTLAACFLFSRSNRAEGERLEEDKESEEDDEAERVTEPEPVAVPVPPGAHPPWPRPVFPPLASSAGKKYYGVRDFAAHERGAGVYAGWNAFASGRTNQATPGTFRGFSTWEEAANFVSQGQPEVRRFIITHA